MAFLEGQVSVTESALAVGEPLASKQMGNKKGRRVMIEAGKSLGIWKMLLRGMMMLLREGGGDG